MNSEHASRRQLLKILASAGITGPLALDLAAQARTKISADILRNAAAVRGETFTEERLQVIETALQRNLEQFQIVRDFEIDDLVEPAPIFVATRHDATPVAEATAAAAAAHPGK